MLAGWLALLFGLGAIAAELPKLAARVTDLTNTLHAQQRANLEQKLAAIEQRKGSQVVVAIVPTTQPETIEQYAVALFEQNAIGRKGVDDGVLLLVAKDDRKVRIEVGYGLEGAIPDLHANRIIAEYLTPKFRVGDFYGGIDEATTALGKLIDGEALPEPLHDAGPRSRGDAGGSVLFAVFIGFFAAQLASVFGRRRRAGRVVGGGTLAAIASFLMLGAVFPIAVATLVAMFLGVVSFAPSGVIGRGGGFGGGGFGGGGWSGGGGRSGGGGASGSW